MICSLKIFVQKRPIHTFFDSVISSNLTRLEGEKVMQIQFIKPACFWLKRRALACLFALIWYLLNCSYQAWMGVDRLSNTALLLCRTEMCACVLGGRQLAWTLTAQSLPDTKYASWCAITVLNEAFQCFLHILCYFSHASCLILFIAVVGHIELFHVLCLLTCCAVIPVKHSNNSLYVRRLRAKKPLRRFLKRICNITDVFVIRLLQMISSAC